MANIEYASPFKSMIAGQTAALQNIEKAQAARQTNLDYKFNEWYQPLKQAETQSGTAGNLLKEAAAIAHYTGDYSNYNAIIAHYLGVPLERLPPGYAGGKGTPAQTKAADLASGQLPIPLSYPNVYMAGNVGAYPQVPGKPADPEIDAAHREYVLAAYRQAIEAAKGGGGAAANPNVPELDPLHGMPVGAPAPTGAAAPVTGAPPIPMPEQAPMAAPRIPGANAAAGDAAKNLGAGDAAAAYGIPQPKAPAKDIFEGGYDPAAFGSN